jgi:hypothetical protein
MCFSRPRLNFGVTDHLNVILSAERRICFSSAAARSSDALWLPANQFFGGVYPEHDEGPQNDILNSLNDKTE